ncbi:MAG: TonB-dependent receptor [Gammaproteobacteria bacterium]|jgi:vitamin B12 transporter|nr:TonB-dependent receptor [Gammaproteobacteria bacterium]MBT5202838.1 TonB-dependent receptor [Gammaproteobacteria bacterium]MBT5603507.1 TonB-dependent receptor [Gammaproteobacteria bacterium]MBT6244178.1 TonB-dependent receptor [Gammaproteobacteria bacterium]
MYHVGFLSNQFQFLALLCLLSLSQAARPDSTSTPETNELEQITVTASRLPVISDKTGSAITIIDQEEIQKRNPLSLSELFRTVPGLSVSQVGPAGSLTQIRIRGAEANQILVMIDGIEANDVSQGSEFNFAHLLPNQIQRIEIVRGPQSAIWGSDSLAGVIHIITNQAGAKDNAVMQLGIGSQDIQQFSISNRFHIDETAVSLGLESISSRGENASRVGTEEDGYRNTTLSAGLHRQLNDTYHLALSLRTTRSQTEYDDVDFITTGLPVDAPFRTKSKQGYGGITLSYNNNDNLSQHLRLGLNASDNANYTFPEADTATQGQRQHLDYQLSFHNQNHRFTGIIETERETFEQQGPISLFGNPNKNLSTLSRAVASEYRYSKAKFGLSMSARSEHNSDFQSSLSWRLTLAGLLNNGDTKISFAAGRAIKNPSFTERFGYFNSFIGNPDLRPEQALSYEIGLRQRFQNLALTLEGHLFSNHLKNEINGFSYIPEQYSFTAINEQGKSSRNGFELSMHWAPTTIVAIKASYTYLDSQELSGAMEIRRPRHTGSVSLSYESENTQASLSYIITGTQQDDFYPPYPPYQERVVLEKFALTSLDVTHRLSSRLRLKLQVSNLLDQQYEEVFGYNAPGITLFTALEFQLY